MSSPALPSTLRRPAAVSQAKKRSTSSRRDVVQALGGRNHQRLQWPQVGVGQRRFGQQGRRAVDAAQALDVHRQRVQEDAGRGVACDLRQVGIGLVRMAAATGLLRASNAQRIGVVDLIGMEMLPDLGDDFHRRFKTVGVAGQCRCIDGAGRGAADHAEGVAHAGHRPQGAAADALQRTQHTDLVGGTGATAAEHQGSQGGFVNGGTPAAEPAHAAISLGCGRIVGRPAARRSVAGPAIQPRPRGCGAQARDAGPGASDEPSASGCITRPGRDRHT